MALQLRFGRVPSTKKRDEQINPIANFFKTKDDRWICLSPRAGGDWDLPQVARAIGREEWLEDERFNNPKKISIKLFLNNIQQLVVRLFQEPPTLYRIYHLFFPLI